MLLSLVFAFAPLFADSSAAYPPYQYDTQGGKLSPVFSAANAEAIHFLSIVDNQVYDGAWGDSGSLMKDVVPRDVWSAGMQSIRMKLGVVKARKVSGFQNLKSLPGGTQGEFIIIKYETEFANKPNSIENVTLMMQAPLGLWKVISYSLSK